MSAISQPGEQAPAPATSEGGGLAWLLGLVFRDLKTKALALVFAILVWVYINAEITTTTTLAIPVQIEIDGQSIMVTDTHPSLLKLVLAGPKEKISQLQPKMLVRTVKIRAGELPTGAETRELERSASRFFSLPPGITLRKEPQQVRVTVVRAVTRSLKVLVKFKKGSEPAAGHEIKKVTLSPTEVRIRGPITVMKHLTRIETKPIDISGRSTTTHINVDVQGTVEDEAINYLEQRPVSITIAIGPIEKPFSLKLRRTVQVRYPADFPYLLKQVKEPELELLLTGKGMLTEDDKAGIYIEADLSQLDKKVLEEHYKGTKYRIVVRGLPRGFKAQVQRGKDPVEQVLIELDKKASK